ncbi:MAG: sodium:proton antiporter NhaD [Simkaniaceae bacterium]
MDPTLAIFFILVFFCIGYLAIIFEFQIKVNKTAVALFLGVILWMFYFIAKIHPVEKSVEKLAWHLSDISQILFFLLGAMTLVELIDSHNGFHVVTRLIQAKSKKQMLWIICFISFFLSAVLDNLTTTILMISLLRKLVPSQKERFLLACMVIVSANAGGAWTPIGDVTTTMLWINGQISTLSVMRSVFVPSLLSLAVPLFYFTWKVKGNYRKTQVEFDEDPLEPGARLVFFLGISALIFVPIFKWLTGMPPYMGMLAGLSVLWLVTDWLHYKHEHRQHLRIPHILTKIDVSSILFFLGILLSVDALESAGMLKTLANFLEATIKEKTLIASAIGILSAIIDNVPLVAGTMGMYPLAEYPIDSKIWLMIAYAAGTGGSILLIGSSAGVALMGLEKVNFFAYMKKMSLPVLIGYLLGIIYYYFV